MVFISIGRYIGIRNPLRARQGLIVSRRAVIYKIALAWLLSALVSCPITILAFLDPLNIQPNSKACFINNQQFLIYGNESSLFPPFHTFIFLGLTLAIVPHPLTFSSSSFIFLFLVFHNELSLVETCFFQIQLLLLLLPFHPGRHEKRE
jgi:hypothetical protein